MQGEAMRDNRRLAQSLLITCLVAATPAHAEVYKWVDANGKVQYSDSPPADRKAGLVKGVPAAQQGAGPTDWQEKDRDFRRRKILKEESMRKEEEENQQVKEKRAATCIEAHEQIDDLNSGKRIYRMNAKGERVYFDEADRAAAMKSARQAVTENCRS
jgi:hypothetical protein